MVGGRWENVPGRQAVSLKILSKNPLGRAQLGNGGNSEATYDITECSINLHLEDIIYKRAAAGNVGFLWMHLCSLANERCYLKCLSVTQGAQNMLLRCFFLEYWFDFENTTTNTCSKSGPSYILLVLSQRQLYDVPGCVVRDICEATSFKLRKVDAIGLTRLFEPGEHRFLKNDLSPHPRLCWFRHRVPYIIENMPPGQKEWIVICAWSFSCSDIWDLTGYIKHVVSTVPLQCHRPQL